MKLYLNNREATTEESETFFAFIRHLKSSEKVRFVFRGQSNIHEIYNTPLDNTPVLSQLVFLLGEKGKLFFEGRKQYKNVFQFLWERYHNKVCNIEFESEETRKHINDFFKNNPEIKKYFSGESNKDEFLGLAKLNKKERDIIVDYYMAILHTIGVSGNSKTYFLSTSKKYSIAKEFANEGKGIILYGWVPRKGMKHHIVKYEDFDTSNTILKEKGLPMCSTTVYPEQKEICLKCGLLPHFIIGYQYRNNFYINPATLNSWDESIVYDGMIINQTEFNECFNNSQYTSSYIFSDGDYYIISKDGVINI